MDPTRFDALAKSFTASASRRAALAGLISGLAAFVIPEREVRAKRRKRRDTGRAQSHDAPRAGSDRVGIENKRKKKKKKKSPVLCSPDCTGGKNCGSNGCNGGSCGSCTAPRTCGGGGAPGVCGCTPLNACPIGQNCGTVPDGCGGTVSCGLCTAPQTCGGGGTAGVCGSSGCIPNCYNPNGPSRICGPDGCGGQCGFNDGNCYLNQICTDDGRCVCPADKPTSCSREGCVDLISDESNCGLCGNGCAPGFTCCNGFCAYPPSDPFNCGGCGTVCSTPKSACCSGACVDVNNDPGNCGMCRHSSGNGQCPQDWGCFGGTCRPPG